MRQLAASLERGRDVSGRYSPPDKPGILFEESVIRDCSALLGNAAVGVVERGRVAALDQAMPKIAKASPLSLES